MNFSAQTKSKFLAFLWFPKSATGPGKNQLQKSCYFSTVLLSLKSRLSQVSLICSPPIIPPNISFFLLSSFFYFSPKEHWSTTDDSSLPRNWVTVLVYIILQDQILFILSPDSCLDIFSNVLCKLWLQSKF